MFVDRQMMLKKAETVGVLEPVSYTHLDVYKRQRFYCPVFGVKPTGYEAARDAEKAELDRERIRLWYVAATRARELLVLPRLDVAARSSAWISLLDLALGDLPALDPVSYTHL